jgi:hypothetical protein
MGTQASYSIKNIVEDTSPQLGGDLDVNGNSIDFGAIITTNETYKGSTMTVTVDTNSIGFGALLTQSADFNFDEADASDVDTVRMIVMALESGTGSKKVLLKGQICNTSWNWSSGAVYASEASGELTQDEPPVTAEDAAVIVIGWALSADTIYFNPYNSWATRYAEEATTTTTEVATTTTTT